MINAMLLDWMAMETKKTLGFINPKVFLYGVI